MPVSSAPSAPAARDDALDALRGISVLGMVLSGSIAFGGVLPGWMYHAQVPPPPHRFDPSHVGITWVDLVFPFFLFAMGAALPFALAQQQRWQQWAWVALRRFAALLFLAIFYQHMKAASLSPAGQASAATHALSLLGFCVLGALLGPGPKWLKAVAALLGVALLSLLPFADGNGFKATRSDIILVVLANMAWAGTLVHALTRRQPLARWALLPFVAAVLLAGSAAGSWTQWLLHATPAPWAYKFLYLKYLFLLVPGMFAGEWLMQWAQHASTVSPAQSVAPAVAALLAANVALLYARELWLNLALTALLCGWLLWQVRDALPAKRHLVHLGVYLLALGLAFEALEGGIRKDSSTFSYYFVTGGLATLCLVALREASAWRRTQALVAACAAQGRNPLLGYVAGALLVAPLLHLLGLHAAWTGLNQGAWQGLLRGLLFTAAVAAVVVLANRWRWVWRA